MKIDIEGKITGSNLYIKPSGRLVEKPKMNWYIPSLYFALGMIAGVLMMKFL